VSFLSSSAVVLALIWRLVTRHSTLDVTRNVRERPHARGDVPDPIPRDVESVVVEKDKVRFDSGGIHDVLVAVASSRIKVVTWPAVFS
jgi:hypothetical protein